MKRRDFIRSAGALTATAAVGTLPAFSPVAENKLPRWRGFNLLDFFSPDPSRSRKKTSPEELKWMADWGFDFVRIPMAYPYYLKFDRTRNITPEEVYSFDEQAIEQIESLVHLAHQNGLHVSLNLHRAPGYCVNAGFNEPYNLWTDQEALDAFCHHWAMWARRFSSQPPSRISFDLVNEPSMRKDMNDQHSPRSSVPGDLYRKVAKAAADAIRKENPGHLVIADGNDVGTTVIPEITDLNIAQSCRGYYPGIISHYKAPWAHKDVDNLPEPKWPGQVGDRYLDRKMLEDFYRPWVELMKKGVGVHCGECGCWNKTPHDVFIAWFTDVMDILKGNQIGYALWEFSGSFGVLDSGREDIAYEDWYGRKLDRRLLTLLMNH